MLEFDPFSVTHALVVLVFVTGTVGLVWFRRQLRQHVAQRRLDLTLAGITFVGWIVINTRALLPQNFDPQTSWPLHFCDIVALLAPVVLIYPKRWVRAVVYYWGLGLCTQGFITPGIDVGPANFGFWAFWANHYVVVGTALYDLIARRYRPGWWDFFIASTLCLGYIAVILPIDLTFGLNYGYVGPRRAEQPSLLDHLGPWPHRLALMIGLGYLVMLVLTLPWTVARRRAHAR